MSPWQQRLNHVLQSWVGTPFMRGQCCRGRGVDCRYFVVAVLDELHGVTAPLPERAHYQTGRFDRVAAIKGIREIQRRYPSRVCTGETLEPGDVLVVRFPGTTDGTYQHLMILGAGSPTPVWHASVNGVAFTGFSGFTITHAFRPTGKTCWAS